MGVISAISDPRSDFYALMRRENVPANELMGRRMEIGVLAVLGQLRARRNWHRIAREWWFGDAPETELGRRRAGLLGAAAASLRRLGDSPLSSSSRWRCTIAALGTPRVPSLGWGTIGHIAWSGMLARAAGLGSPRRLLLGWLTTGTMEPFV